MTFGSDRKLFVAMLAAGLYGNVSLLVSPGRNVSTTVQQIVMKCCTGIQFFGLCGSSLKTF